MLTALDCVVDYSFNAMHVVCAGQERSIHDKSMHTSCTVEMADVNRRVDVAVIDEIQMMADPNRGWAWTRALQGRQSLGGNSFMPQCL